MHTIASVATNEAEAGFLLTVKEHVLHSNLVYMRPPADILEIPAQFCSS